jgi:MFS family permease
VSHCCSLTDDALDKRVWPIAASTFVTGSAIGVALPVMPLFCAELGLSTAEFGLVGSVFGGARLLSNLPLAVAAERFGRRAFLIWGPALTAVSMVGTGLSGSLGVLLGWRVLTGLGGAAQMTGAQLYLADISKPSNRARTLAPTSAAFSAGASVGPAIGGLLAQNFGVVPCFFYVGGAIGVVAAMNWHLLPETKAASTPLPAAMAAADSPCSGSSIGSSSSSSSGDRFKGGAATPNSSVASSVHPAPRGWGVVGSTLRTWQRLFGDRGVRVILFSHLAYWTTLSGSQFTLMPLLASQTLHMAPGEVGAIFAMTSAINVFVAPLAAKWSDQYGRRSTIVPGLGLIACSVCLLPEAASGAQLTLLMAVWACGGAIVSTGPTAYLADLVDEKDRASALSMLRSFGDLGLMLGAGSLGCLAHATSMEAAFWANGALLAAATANMALRGVEPTPHSGSGSGVHSSGGGGGGGSVAALALTSKVQPQAPTVTLHKK